ncbi:hypothetical protein L6164_002290 [Bauhinia variegata]|uniref:Uncharacterized protein n=1 Tax=Bauhinia variegata TaxID=167791 RepID=A0ACB9PXR3_BAUVA|nr:hypothetical protein L6164_002290 [Bauhinia variegata]
MKEKMTEPSTSIKIDDGSNSDMGVNREVNVTYMKRSSYGTCKSFGNAIEDIHTFEFLNGITPSSLPTHKLTLKVGVPVMLLRNIDERNAICNGTRLFITQLENHTPAFIPSESEISTIRVWVHFPELSMLYYNESVLKVIASTIRRSIKVDINTLEVLRGRFARVCL